MIHIADKQLFERLLEFLSDRDYTITMMFVNHVENRVKFVDSFPQESVDFFIEFNRDEKTALFSAWSSPSDDINVIKDWDSLIGEIVAGYLI